MNDIVNITETAIQSTIGNLLKPFNVPVYISDESQVKEVMPYCVIHADGYEEVIAPGSGIFKVRVNLIYRSHVKESDANDRSLVVGNINAFAYSNPAQILSQIVNYHVYGFVPVSGNMTVNADRKAYEYNTVWDVYCMPRDNS